MTKDDASIDAGASAIDKGDISYKKQDGGTKSDMLKRLRFGPAFPIVEAEETRTFYTLRKQVVSSLS